MGERLEIDRLRFALERDFRYGFPLVSNYVMIRLGR